MKNFATDCDLDNLKGSLLRDMLIISLHDKKLQEHLLRKINLTLDRILVICQTTELTRSHAQAIQRGTSYSNDYNVDVSQNKVSQDNVDAIRRNRKDFEQSSKQEMIMKLSFALILTNVVLV